MSACEANGNHTPTRCDQRGREHSPALRAVICVAFYLVFFCTHLVQPKKKSSKSKNQKEASSTPSRKKRKRSPSDSEDKKRSHKKLKKKKSKRESTPKENDMDLEDGELEAGMCWLMFVSQNAD